MILGRKPQKRLYSLDEFDIYKITFSFVSTLLRLL